MFCNKPYPEAKRLSLGNQVEAIGANITQFRQDNEMFGSSTQEFLAEFTSIPEADLVVKPANLTFEEATSVLGAAYITLHALYSPNGIRWGQKVLINGTSGGGTLRGANCQGIGYRSNRCM